MRRRPSGSTSEDDDDLQRPAVARPPVPGYGDKPVERLGESAHPLRRDGQPKDRRKEHAAAPRAKPHIWTSPTPSPQPEKEHLAMPLLAKDITPDSMVEGHNRRRLRMRNPWSCSLLTLATTAVAFVILFIVGQSFMFRQLDPKGCEMSYMRPSFIRFSDFDTEHTRFASKYSLYLYREGGIDEDKRVKGVPVLFIPGNAGSYKQVRPLGAEAAYHYHNVLRHDEGASRAGKRPLDFFSVDFNEDITAFHGQTLLDQAEYLNDAISFILSLYHNPSKSLRDSDLPDPSSVIIVGHSMGGIVARTMLTMLNYQSNSINTIVTLSAPHARPPVSFDGDIVKTYKRVNDYWRHAYSQTWAIDNPLWHVTLISIAGGGLDTIVPSDYASIASLVPDTHGFTVFTASIPNVWTGMDHLAITWCDQFRKSVVRSIYDVIDVSRPTQTLPRAERMRGFKKWFLTGLEDVAEKTLPHKEPKTLLTLEDNSNAISSQGERLVLRNLGQAKKPKAHLLPIPPQGAPEGRKFTLLTNQQLDAPGENGKLEVLFCSVFPLQAGQSATLFSMNMDLSGDSTGSTRLACKNAASDAIMLPESTRKSTQPFKSVHPFSYLQYDLEDLAEHQFVAVVDKVGEQIPGWVFAEFSASSESVIKENTGLQRLLATGLDLKFPAQRPMVMDIKIPALRSSLLAYTLKIGKQSCDSIELFTPLLRQYISEVYESKFFVNVKEVNINLHGVAPYMPPPFLAKHSSNGLGLQIWSDPTCDSAMTVSLKIDVIGSMGKLWMRYRIVFAAFPLLVVALVLRKQFKVYDETAIFMSFSESLNLCLRSSLPVSFIALTFFAISLAKSSQDPARTANRWFSGSWNNASASAVDYTRNDLLLGSQDTFFWFLVPLFGLLCVGICVAVNYVAIGVTHAFAVVYSLFYSASLRGDDGRRTPTAFAVTSTKQRVITTSVLLLLVSTFIPYHFAYMVLCIVQIATCTRAYKLVRETRSDTNYNFYNYTHSILVLMLWILPINLPVLVVWIRNLAVHWLTPFSSHHNILSIMPFILLVETLSTGRMVPRVTARIRYLTNVLLFALAVYAAVYGVTYAYLLHHIANILCAWLVVLHLSNSSFSLSRLNVMLEGVGPDGHVKKRP
ncbi:GPI inositol-deacylase [Mytilinidion resinicola]|uniref:GPI inositol-deacylase n=1 Tax=Mytilinidion resinicola TaxID=574789 RepID=A0A6A6Y2P8_9PEZI|nr:GPI inositol-deacylase [Mytilinidion resinicola]KAF2802940.1 GPI inositol-deacylase [Mytilinidion resinicola]